MIVCDLSPVTCYYTTNLTEEGAPFPRHGSRHNLHVVILLGEVSEKTRPPADLGAGPGQLEAPRAPSLDGVFRLPSPLPEAALRTQPWDRDGVLRLSGWGMRLTRRGLSTNFQDSGGGCSCTGQVS